MSKIYWVDCKKPKESTTYKKQFLSKTRHQEFIKKCSQKGWTILKIYETYL